MSRWSHLAKNQLTYERADVRDGRTYGRTDGRTNAITMDPSGTRGSKN